MLSGERNTGCSASNMMQPEVASKHLDVMAVPPSILKGRHLQLRTKQALQADMVPGKLRLPHLQETLIENVVLLLGSQLWLPRLLWR